MAGMWWPWWRRETWRTVMRTEDWLRNDWSWEAEGSEKEPVVVFELEVSEWIDHHSAIDLNHVIFHAQ